MDSISPGMDIKPLKPERKTMTLKLDHILTEPLDVDIGGTIYTVDDPGIMKIARVVSLTESILSGDTKVMQDFLASVRAMVPAIPDEVFNALSVKQLGILNNEIGKHFLKAEGDGDKSVGPLPGSVKPKSEM